LSARVSRETKRWRFVATTAKLTVFVTSTRGKSIVRIGTTGKYVSTPVNTVEIVVNPAPLMTTATVGDFWRAVMAVVNAQLAGVT
jgi:hypothetical protein